MNKDLSEFYQEHKNSGIKLEESPKQFEINFTPGILVSSKQGQVTLKYTEHNFQVEISQDQFHPGTYDINMEISKQAQNYEAIVSLESIFKENIPDDLSISIINMDTIIKHGQTKVKIGKILANIEETLNQNYNITLKITVEELTPEIQNAEIKMLQNLQANINQRIKELENKNKK